ncbi:MAG: 3'(2'),5'-bisphosphate nucleotidase CysQ [Planctomycetota bacterium]
MATLTDAEIERDLAFAIETARDAGDRIKRLRASGRWEEPKLIGDIGDQAADGYLQGIIRGRYPDDGLLSEETADSAERLSRDRAWIVDPLDGTKEFGAGRDDWAVHVALTVGGRCALGAVALPSLGQVLWGVTVEGRESAGMDGEGNPARGDSPSPATPRIAVSRSHTPPWVESFADKLGGAELRPWGSAGFKVSRLLVGEADLYVHKVGLKEWDTCAPETVARALGWHVCKLRGEEHAYNQANPKNHELVICRPAERERVLAAIEASGALAD